VHPQQYSSRALAAKRLAGWLQPFAMHVVLPCDQKAPSTLRVRESPGGPAAASVGTVCRRSGAALGCESDHTISRSEQIR
jgi:hypothetical protein